MYQIYSNCFHVIYTLDTNGVPNIMILCGLSSYPDILFIMSLMVKMPKSEKGIIQSNSHRILRNLNQVDYIKYPVQYA